MSEIGLEVGQRLWLVRFPPGPDGEDRRLYKVVRVTKTRAQVVRDGAFPEKEITLYRNYQGELATRGSRDRFSTRIWKECPPIP